MPLYHETVDDYRIKYSGCYAKASCAEKGVASVAMLTEDWKTNAQSKVTAGVVRFYLKTEKNKTMGKDMWVELKSIDFHPLKMGAVNLAKSVVCILSTKPHSSAKYRKLPCDGNLRVIDPFEEEREFLKLRPVGTIKDYFLLDAWGNNEYLPAVDALKLVSEHKRLGAAFSPNYFFGISMAGDGIFLYSGYRRVARVNSQGEILLKPPVHWLVEQLSEYGLTVRRIDK